MASSSSWLPETQVWQDRPDQRPGALGQRNLQKHFAGVLLDPYERVCVWSHAVPGLCFLILGVLSYAGYTPGSTWVHNPLGIFCLCAATTHLLSAATHVYPDSVSLEKTDHLGIVVLILGTPITALMAHTRGGIPLDLQIAGGIMLAAAFLPPTPRVLGFTAGVLCMVGLHFRTVLDANMAVQLGLYGIGAYAFLRNGGHGRFAGCSDHHVLHYSVTIACILHVFYLLHHMHAP